VTKATATVKQVMGPVEWGLLLVLALLWGGAFFFSKIAVGELPPFTVVLCRVVIAALALLSTAAGYIVVYGAGWLHQRAAGDAPHPAERATAGRPLPGGVSRATRSRGTRVHRRRAGGDRRSSSPLAAQTGATSASHRWLT
jgi:hypothetical protein